MDIKLFKKSYLMERSEFLIIVLKFFVFVYEKIVCILYKYVSCVFRGWVVL